MTDTDTIRELLQQHGLNPDEANEWRLRDVTRAWAPNTVFGHELVRIDGTAGIRIRGTLP